MPNFFEMKEGKPLRSCFSKLKKTAERISGLVWKDKVREKVQSNNKMEEI
jgi:hypothetical protein